MKAVAYDFETVTRLGPGVGAVGSYYAHVRDAVRNPKARGIGLAERIAVASLVLVELQKGFLDEVNLKAL